MVHPKTLIQPAHCAITLCERTRDAAAVAAPKAKRKVVALPGRLGVEQFGFIGIEQRGKPGTKTRRCRNVTQQNVTDPFLTAAKVSSDLPVGDATHADNA
jgi:hypothetical protein